MVGHGTGLQVLGVSVYLIPTLGKQLVPQSWRSFVLECVMKGLLVISLLLIVAIVLVAVVTISIYNRLIRSRNQYENAFSQIDIQMRRRYDLIPNLVETAKGYVKHERETLEAVIAARTGAMIAEKVAAASPGDAKAVQNLQQAEGTLDRALVNFRSVAEQYPELKADKVMGQLFEELGSTENRISFARQAYNDAVTTYNTLREVFPNNRVAGAFNFRSAALLDLEREKISEAPRVSF
jgi:LemA protein